MKTVATLLEEFSGMGEKHFFCLKSDEECEGWIVNVQSDAIYFLGCDMAPEAEPLKIRLGAIDLDTLEYHDPEQRGWISARWDDAQERWETKSIQTANSIPVQTSSKPASTSSWFGLKLPLKAKLFTRVTR